MQQCWKQYTEVFSGINFKACFEECKILKTNLPEFIKKSMADILKKFLKIKFIEGGLKANFFKIPWEVFEEIAARVAERSHGRSFKWIHGKISKGFPEEFSEIITESVKGFLKDIL